MGNEYRTEKKILASELFDGRLKKFDIQEHDRGHSDRNYRCLSDGEKRLGVLINEVGYITGFVREWNGDWSALPICTPLTRMAPLRAQLPLRQRQVSAFAFFRPSAAPPLPRLRKA